MGGDRIVVMRPRELEYSLQAAKGTMQAFKPTGYAPWVRGGRGRHFLPDVRSSLDSNREARVVDVYGIS
jgi:hypothetical protein